MTFAIVTQRNSACTVHTICFVSGRGLEAVIDAVEAVEAIDISMSKVNRDRQHLGSQFQTHYCAKDGDVISHVTALRVQHHVSLASAYMLVPAAMHSVLLSCTHDYHKINLRSAFDVRWFIKCCLRDKYRTRRNLDAFKIFS